MYWETSRSKKNCVYEYSPDFQMDDIRNPYVKHYLESKPNIIFKDSEMSINVHKHRMIAESSL